MFKRPGLVLATVLVASPAMAFITPVVAPSAVVQEQSLTDTLVAAVQAGQADAVAAGLSPADGQAAIEQVVQTVIATSGVTPDDAVLAIRATRLRLACPSDISAPGPATCPAWVNAALVAVETQVSAEQTGGAAPAATGGPSGGSSMPPPPSGGGGGGGGSGYRPIS